MVRALRYGAHASDLKNNKFIQKELAEQLQEYHVAIVPWEAVKHLSVLWLPPITTTPQAGRNPQIIYTFSWSGLNVKPQQFAPKEAMQFGKALYRLLDYILAT